MGIRATPIIYDFAAAKRLWARTPPWRGDSTPSARPLADRRDKHITIRSTDDPSSPVYCRLYNTDCVTFHADGTIGITGYPSKSTVEFIRRVVGHYVDPLRLCEAYRVHGGRVVRGPNITLRLTGDYSHPVDVVKSEPFTFHKLNRQKTTAFFKSLRWGEFRTWALTAYDILNGDLDAVYAAAVEAFPAVYDVLVHSDAPGHANSGRHLTQMVRQTVLGYSVHRLRDTEEVAYCTSYEDYMRRVQADRRAS